MSHLDFYHYPYQQSYSYFYSYLYHLGHRENTSWERRFDDGLAEKNEKKNCKRGSRKSMGWFGTDARGLVMANTQEHRGVFRETNENRKPWISYVELRPGCWVGYYSPLFDHIVSKIKEVTEKRCFLIDHPFVEENELGPNHAAWICGALMERLPEEKPTKFLLAGQSGCRSP